MTLNPWIPPQECWPWGQTVPSANSVIFYINTCNQAPRQSLLHFHFSRQLILLTEIRTHLDGHYDTCCQCGSVSARSTQRSAACKRVSARKCHLVEVNVLHPHVLHHGRLLVDVRSDDAESWAALPEHTWTYRYRSSMSVFSKMNPWKAKFDTQTGLMGDLKCVRPIVMSTIILLREMLTLT